MTQKHENLSAFMDGEVRDEGTIEALAKDQALSAKWQRYHLIRQGLRKELPEYADFDISAQVAEALQEEPEIVAPKPRLTEKKWVANVIPFAKQGGQLAIAASVAVAMVLGVQQYNQPEVIQPFNTAPATFPGIQGGLSPVSLEQSRPIQRTDVMEQRRRINALLTDHQQQLRFKAVSSAPDEVSKADESESQTKSENDPE